MIGQHPNSVASRFKPGNAAWNKGVKGWCPPGSKATQFQPGNLPHTWMPVGSYRVGKDGDLQIKWRDCPGATHLCWKPVARLVWEAYHGPIPHGMIVIFKPGTRSSKVEEIRIQNLECITKAENARRNHPRNKSPELARLVQLKGAITRQVNRIAREAESTTP